MGLIARPPKEGGFLTYVEKVQGGFDLILDTEADADLDTIYNELNGNITNPNISSTAAIAYAKLDLTGSIVAGDLAANAVTTPKILDGAVTTPKLADEAVTPAKLALESKTIILSVPFTASSTAATFGETTLLTTPFVVRADRVLRLTVDWAALLSVTGAGIGALTTRIRSDGTEIAKRIWGYGLVGNMPIPGFGVTVLLAAGVRTLTVTAEAAGTGTATFILSAAPGNLAIMEFPLGVP